MLKNTNKRRKKAKGENVYNLYESWKLQKYIKLLNQKLKLEEGGKEFLKENLFRRKQNQLCLKSPPNHAKRELTKLTNRKAAYKRLR